MAGVIQPQKKQNMLAAALPVAGQVLGTAFGGPVGGLAGGKLGEAISGSRQDNTPATVASQGGGAIDRRIQTIGAQQDPSKDLAAAEAATATLPPDMQKQYQPILARARQLSEQGRGMA